jgi:hypothetical protein
MRVEVKEDTIKEYPCLMISEYGTIVLFRERSCGVVLSSHLLEIGLYSNEWDMNDFNPFNASVTLSNK